ncbi:PilZ domain-containing protein [Sphingomonas sp. CL5.1]|uniref:PilZ domain-containing protein n=1 Tax=Sphingomonas sp. CL5.1 TaxID=2653203 RepID=UPI0015831656|nr:PilZ domain-containing protein [Sphingomonas sp. CL5.1]QKR99558.1 PilZ domain-containing protein [Sphingomonas sp. CL5.1]
MKHLDTGAFADAAPLDGQGRGRESVSFNARLRVGDAKRAAKVRIRNVSPGGLMAEVPRPLAPDAAVEIELAGIGWVAGRVAWQIEGRVGVAFDSEIDPRRLQPAADA